MTIFFVILMLVGFAGCAFLYVKNGKIKNTLEKKLAESKDRDEFLFEQIPFFYKNPLLDIELCTPALQKILGVDGPLNLEQLRDFFRSNNQGILGSTLQSLHDGRKVKPLLLKLPDSNKSIRCFVERVANDDGALSGVLLIFHKLKDDSVGSKKRLKQDLTDLINLLNSSPYPMWKRNENQEIVYANLTYLKLFDVKQRLVEDVNGLEIYQGGAELALKSLKLNKPCNERRHLVAKGERKLYKITETPINNNSTMGYARDISEQEEVEAALEQNVVSQSQFLESSTNATVIYGPDKKLKFFNAAFVALWGLEDGWLSNNPKYSEVLEKLREDRKLPEQVDFKGFKEKQLSLFTELLEPSSEFFYLPDGKVLRVISVPHESGGIIFSYEDITDRLALEQSYNTLIAVKKATIDNLQEGIAVFQGNGKINLFNPAFSDIWHLEPEFLEGCPHISSILEETKFLYDFDNKWDEFKEKIVTNLSNHDAERGRIIRKDSSVLDWSKVPLPDGNILVTYNDITDSFLVEKSLRSEREALKEADELKNNFLANVSYELRSPLTSIRGLSEALLQNYLGDINDKQKEYIEDIYKSSLDLSSLIDDIIDMASINAGYLTLDLKEFDLCKLINSIKKPIKDKVAEAKQKLKIESINKKCEIYADKERVSKIITNLISNAISRNSEGAIILLSVKVLEDDIEIVVTDDGEVINKTQQGFIFERIKEASRTSGSTVAAPTLPVVKSFAELHGGSVSVTSSKDSGAQFICTLPKIASTPHTGEDDE